MGAHYVDRVSINDELEIEASKTDKEALGVLTYENNDTADRKENQKSESAFRSARVRV